MSVILFIILLIPLSVVFKTYPELNSDGSLGQQYYLAGACAIVAVCLLVWTLLREWKAETEGGEKNSSNRHNSGQENNFSIILSWCLMFCCVVEVLWGIGQVYGVLYSRHAMYALSGSFYNPGPYSGYLALVLPIALHEYLRHAFVSAKYNNVDCEENSTIIWIKSCWKRIVRYTALIVVLLVVCVLPAGMSRSAWLAAVVSSFFVLWTDGRWNKKVTSYRKKHPRVFRLWLCLALFLLLALAVGMFYMKKDSAHGRLFMWKISLKAIVEKPLTGYGSGGFPAAYGAAQEAYFLSGGFSDTEVRVAGCPQYAFNEYLHTAVEHGIPFTILLLAIISLIFYRGFRKRLIGICGGIISLAVFSFSSYPFRMPAFWVVLLLMLVACLIENKRSHYLLLSVATALIGSFLWLDTCQEYPSCRSWNEFRALYQNEAYEEAVRACEEYHADLKNNVKFLFEYGHSLHKLKRYEESNAILMEAAQKSCDPMILNIIGKNHQGLKQYEEAEHYFIRSTHLIPGRMYPYFLLVNLYAEPDNYKEDKLLEAARQVLEFEPKIPSTAIDEMRLEVKKILIANKSKQSPSNER